MSLSDITRIQPKAWSLLARSYTTGRIASTYLFHGREGLGDWPLALAFAALLNCPEPTRDTDNPELVYPCGQCRSCRSIEAVNFEGLHIVVPIKTHRNLSEAVDFTNEVIQFKREHPFRLLDRSSATSVPIDMAREVKRSLTVKGAEGIRRVALFYHMDAMRQQSADALLKLIEEPPSDTVIILTATRPEKLLPTIRSRSQKLRLDRVAEGVLTEYLQTKYQASESQAKLAARISDGVPGVAIEAVQGEDDESGYRAVGMLLFRSLFDESGPEVVSQLTEMVRFSDREQVDYLLRLWQSLLRDCAYYAATGEEADIINIDFLKETKRLSVPFGNAVLARTMTESIKNTLADLSRNVHIQTALVALTLKLKNDLRTTYERLKDNLRTT